MSDKKYQSTVREKLKNLNVESLKEVIKQANNDFRNGTDTLFEVALDLLEKKLETKEYVKFLEFLN